MAARVRKPNARGAGKQTPRSALSQLIQAEPAPRPVKPVLNAAEPSAARYEERITQIEIFQPPPISVAEPISAEAFDEAGYLRLNPDVRLALERGQIQSGHAHYLRFGMAEGRPVPGAPREARNVMLASAIPKRR